MAKAQTARMMTLKEVKRRGWTDALMDKLGLAPDLFKRNPKYRSAPEMELYSPSKVEELERHEDFQKHMEKRKARRPAIEKALETKKQKTLSLVDGAIAVPVMNETQLIQRACNSYNKRHPNSERPASEQSPRDFLVRITVNYLRHQLSTYDDKLEMIGGKVGTGAALQRLRNKIYKTISEAYPFLETECDRQLLERARIEALCQAHATSKLNQNEY